LRRGVDRGPELGGGAPVAVDAVGDGGAVVVEQGSVEAACAGIEGGSGRSGADPEAELGFVVMQDAVVVDEVEGGGGVEEVGPVFVFGGGAFIAEVAGLVGFGVGVDGVCCTWFGGLVMRPVGFVEGRD